MIELEVDRAEIAVIMKGLNCIGPGQLTETESAVRAGLAFKLGAARAALFIAEKAERADG